VAPKKKTGNVKAAAEKPCCTGRVCCFVVLGIILITVLLGVLSSVANILNASSSEPQVVYVDSSGQQVSGPAESTDAATSTDPEPAEVTAPKAVDTGSCGDHKWCCNFIEHPILIEEALNSVKLGPKVFTNDEMILLSTVNGDNLKTTWDVFMEIDGKTKSCAFYK